jgi:hypothetical protein
VGTDKRREKVVVLRELQRAIIYTRELSKQVTEGHVSTAFIAYSVDEGARLTSVLLPTSNVTGRIIRLDLRSLSSRTERPSTDAADIRTRLHLAWLRLSGA